MARLRESCEEAAYVKRSSYRDLDYAFGQAMLTLRSAIGLTQAGLADFLGVSRRAVGEWEAGSSYPKAEHLKHFIALAVKEHAFPAGQEAESIRSLWQTSRQKVLLDEAWLAGLFVHANRPVQSQPTRAIDLLTQLVVPATIAERKITAHLPAQPTPFFGRRDELAEIDRILADPACRLLTLFGPGGAGKTRLALEVVARQADAFADGVAFVPLASVGTPDQIITAIAAALDLSFAGQADPGAYLLRSLRDRQMLLVLDNFEHLMAGADLVYDLLERAPRVTILITTRERLNLRAEWLFDVEGLSYPVEDQRGAVVPPTLAELREYSAVQLFVQHALQVQPAFVVSEANLATIARICRHVAGIPLAIELAAAGVRALPVAEIEQQILMNLDVLTTTLRDVPPRHRSLRAVFDQSWNLLDEPERVVLSRLAVFRGGCTAAAAERVVDAPLPALMALVDKSLLRQVSDSNEPVVDFGLLNESRFVFLQPIREYALEKLSARGEAEPLRHAHAEYFLDVAERIADQWDSSAVEPVLEQLEREYDNMRAALEWARDSGDLMVGFQLAAALTRYWRSRGYSSEGSQWLNELLALDEAHPDPALTAARRRAYQSAAWLAFVQRDFAHAARLFEQSMALSRVLNESDSGINLLLNAGLQARAIGLYQRATSLLEEALAWHRAQGDRGSLSAGGLGFSLYQMALVLREQGDFARAEALLQECVELHRTIRDREGLNQGLLGLGDVARDRGDVALTRQYCEQCLTVFREFKSQWAIGFSLNNLAQAAYTAGNWAQAQALVNESAAIFRAQKAEASLAEVLVTLGRVLLAQGNAVAAYEVLTEALRLAWVAGPRLLVATALEGLAAVTAQLGQTPLAIRLSGAASALRGQMGTPLRPADQPLVERTLTSARLALSDEAFAAVWAESLAQPLEQVISAISSATPPVDRPPRVEAALPEPPSAFEVLPTETFGGSPSQTLLLAADARYVDWSDAPAIRTFYGREWELTLLTEWVVEEHCRVVSVLGLGGIGKSTLAINLMHWVADNFQVVLWRSLRDVPTCEALLDDLLQTLAPDARREKDVTIEQRQSLLLEYMRASRTLLVLDNLESILEEGEGAGRMRPGYEGFGRFLRLSAEAEHQSCVLLTSREKAGDLVAFEGNRAPVRTLRLARLGVEACEQLLAEKGVAGTATERAQLIEAYAGNPLALKIVAQTIVDLFDGEIAPFLEQGELIFGGVRDLLNEQFDRLSQLEQWILVWLAILREPSTFDELLAVMVTPTPRARVLEAIEALRRRSLIERGQKPGSFTLQSVVLEYMTARLIAEAASEIEQGQMSRLTEHGLELAQVPEYVRQTQQRLILAPILARLNSTYAHHADVEVRLLMLLNRLRVADDPQGYAPANLVTLLRALRSNLRGLDLSGLSLRGVYLQGIEMQDATLAGATMRDSVFAETFDALTALAVSTTGAYWAAGSRRGEIRMWSAGGRTLHRVWRAHADIVCTLTFSPDGRTLASSGSWDGMVKLWDVASGNLLWSCRHPSQAYGLAFSPDGRLLASTEYNATVHLWDLKSPMPVQTLDHLNPASGVRWSPDGRLLATGDLNGFIRLWAIHETEPAVCIQTLHGHTNSVEGLAFSLDGSTLASGSWDTTVKLWDVRTGRLKQTLTGHTNRVTCLAWSPDGRTLASAGRDETIWLWDAEQGSYRAALRAHTAGVYALAFTPDSRNLVSVSEDGTLRVWDVENGQCLRVMQGYGVSFYDVDWSPDDRQLVAGGSDSIVTVFDVAERTPPRLLRGHRGFVIGVGWSAHGRWLASSEWNNAVHIWDADSGESIDVLRHPDHAGDYFDSLMWHPDGERIAVGTLTSGAQIFAIESQGQPWVGRKFSTWIRHVAWSPDGTRLAGGGADGSVYVWAAADGTLLHKLSRHHTSTLCLAWSPSGTRLASGSIGQEGGELFVWDMQTGERVQSLIGHPAVVYAVAWGNHDDRLITGSGDGTLRWWDVVSGACVHVQDAHLGTVHALRRSCDGTRLASCGGDGAIMLWDLKSQEHLQTLRRDRPYERLNITGIKGLTDAQKATLR